MTLFWFKLLAALTTFSIVAYLVVFIAFALAARRAVRLDAPAEGSHGTREREVARKRLASLHAESADFRESVAADLAELNGRQGDPRSFDRLEAYLKTVTLKKPQRRER